MESKEESKDLAYCRVCHGESEPNNQLFFPCKCDGSIKYVHQDCLVQWLKVSNKQTCELCGEQFHFQKVYKADAPRHIALVDVVMEVIPRALGMAQYGLSTVAAILLWGICLPMFTNWWFKACWCCVTDFSEECVSRVPTFIRERSVDGLLTYWYFGLVDVCVIVAASVVSFEVGHTLYREYQIAKNNYKIRQLELRLAQNRNALHAMEESSANRERALFAVADYESMKYEWDKSKEKYEATIARTRNYRFQDTSDNEADAPAANQTAEDPEEGMESSKDADDVQQQGSASPTLPSIEDRFFMVQSLANDQVHCSKVVERLNAVCSLPNCPPAFLPIRDSYVRLEAELVRTNEQCAQLISLLPSSLVPRKGDIGNIHTHPPLHQPEHDVSRRKYREDWQALHDSQEDGSQEDAAKEEQEDSTPWYESHEEMDLQRIEPSVDNLELRANLLLRQRMREAAEKRRQEALAAPALTLSGPPGDESETETGESDDVYGGEKNDKPECDGAEAAEEGLWAALNAVQCEEEYFRDEPAPAEQRATEDPEAGDRNGENGGFGEYFGTEINMDNVEVAMTLDEAIASVEMRAVQQQQLDSAKEQAFAAASHAESTEQEEPAPAPASPLDVGAELHIAGDEEIGGDEQINAADDPNPVANEVPLVMPPLAPHAPRHGLVSLRNVLLGYAYMMTFVAATLILPALFGEIFLTGTAVGARLVERVEATAHDAVVAEDTYANLLKLLHYLEFSADALDHDPQRLYAAHILTANLRGMVKLAFGYAVLVALALSVFLSTYIHYFGAFDHVGGGAADVLDTVRRNAHFAGDIMHSLVKLAIMVAVLGGITPMVLTVLTAKIVNKSLPPYLRAEGADGVAALLMVALFVFSYLITVHVWYITLELRRAIDRRYLVGVLPEMDEQDAAVNAQGNHSFFALLERLKSVSYSHVLKRILIRTSILLPAYVVSVVVPVRWGHLVCWFAEPLQFRLKQTSGEVQVPVEMMLSHIFLPIIIEKLRYKAVVGACVKGFLAYAAPRLGLEWMLAAPGVAAGAPLGAMLAGPPLDNDVEEHVEEHGEGGNDALDGEAGEVGVDAPQETNDATASNTVQVPAPQWIPTWGAVTLLVVLGLIVLAVISCWVLHAPLATGRAAMVLARLPSHNDFFNYPVGLLVCWGAAFVAHYIVQDVARNAEVHSAAVVVGKWILHAAKVLGVATVWLAGPPLILGVLLEAMIVMPLRVVVWETPNFPLVQNWALGLIILKAFSKCVVNGMFGEIDLRVQMELAIIRGFAQFDAAVCLRRIVVPVTLQLLDLLLTPYCLARCACMLTTSHLLRTVMARYCYHAYVVAICAGHGLYRGGAALIALHNEVRDSKYLIGTKLTNRA